ncbi:DNA repair protein RecN [Photobacterium damselae subsp. piscicida]|uniref:DNA repair protein RecN n=1 Tax=Photobacterium damsela subsp. piscicida TaxID=38294 RepID=A0A5F0YXS8_PHODP|nr:DNA repair protein RecN [Photobacterium damselae]MBE8129989.1 DNA repair protein RecN [Photobacterium damselae subsp. piscicida]PSV77684.1 DNA repair protein RecN [Photobacterium damselae]PSW79960.1 DNA repair protein RecN [Photobacterium damselae]QOD52177.1 DNA repair protein RecN [Photobacterium damselae subsp. piscicida]QOD56031.1 DNA repair protein RecN [Photobacterium damselae subsp. piscicida]
MLSHMTISNFAIVKTLEFELKSGMTTITGETGAGKSIAIDALGLCLGDRTEASMVRPNEDKADISATFSLNNNQSARRWLEDNELIDGEECILRRVITKEGRSRGFINGSPVPVSMQKSLGQLLINIHGQHAHQQLMRPEYQQQMLDQYAGHHLLMEHTRETYQRWRQTHNELKRLTQSREENEAQKQLIQYQVKELDELSLGEDEFDEIEEEHKRLSNSGELAVSSQTALSMLYDNDGGNALQMLQMASQQVCNLGEFDSSLSAIPQMLEDAIIQVQETSQELRCYLDNLDMDPHRLIYLEERLAKIMSLARKHYVMPNDLYQKHQDLLKELENLDCSDERLDEMAQNVELLRQECLAAAEKLSKSREHYAKELSCKISESMHQLSMENGQFCIDIQADPERMLSPLGVDNITFLVSTNPGQPLQPLGKVASGGELSRISLAIQVITAQKVETPSLIFDEVDVGISGPTAAIVGKMLRKLGESTQVMCVTHLPQVAGCGHQQMFVAKKSSEGQTKTNMRPLTVDERVAELARLLGGSEITERTLANAKELLVAA